MSDEHGRRDGEFFAEIVERADCGIVLDLHNLYANERNGRARMRDVLAALPLDRVWEIHDPGVVLGALHEARLPDSPPAGVYAVTVEAA